MLRLLAALSLTIVIAPVSVSAAEIAGRASVIDGDTIAVEGTEKRIRLYGIDAPEGKQTCDDAEGKRYRCGARSADMLDSIIGRNGRVTCIEEDRDRYGRIVADCSIGGKSVSAEMVRSGWAVHFTRYSDGCFDREEASARSGKRGLWAGEFIDPDRWRRGDRLQSVVK